MQHFIYAELKPKLT